MKILNLLVAASVFGLSAMTVSAHADGLVGVLMPTKTSQRWINDGDAVKSQLEAKGYTVDLQYAQDDIPNQLAQLENEITKGPKALIIASIDGTTMADALQKAADAKDLATLQAAAGGMQAACRGCHSVYRQPAGQQKKQ